MIPSTHTETRRRPPRFELTGDHLALNFVNTLDNRPSGQPKELLAQYVDLARFAEDSGILPTYLVDRLIERSMHAPAAEKALIAARELRESFHEVLVAAMEKRPAPPMALARLNGFVQDAAQHAQLVDRKGKLEWQFDELGPAFESPLWPIARAAADLLASDQLGLVGTCASPTCQWFFLDVSKNHRRRWCDMKVCGNRAKAREFYARKTKKIER